MLQCPLSVAEHGEVHEVTLGLFGEAPTLGALDGRKAPIPHRYGPLPETLYHGLNIKLFGHRGRP